MSILSFLRALRDRIAPSEVTRARETLERLRIFWRPNGLSGCCHGLIVGHNGRPTRWYCAACGGPETFNCSGDDFWIGYTGFLGKRCDDRETAAACSEARDAICILRNDIGERSAASPDTQHA